MPRNDSKTKLYLDICLLTFFCFVEICPLSVHDTPFYRQKKKREAFLSGEKYQDIIVTGSFSFLIYLYIKQNEQILI